MQTRVRKWGNSLGVRIPKGVASRAHIDEGSLVEIGEEKGQIIIRQIAPKEWTLDQLLEGVTDENLHDEVPTGAPVGKEAW